MVFLERLRIYVEFCACSREVKRYNYVALIFSSCSLIAWEVLKLNKSLTGLLGHASIEGDALTW